MKRIIVWVLLFAVLMGACGQQDPIQETADTITMPDSSTEQAEVVTEVTVPQTWETCHQLGLDAMNAEDYIAAIEAFDAALELDGNKIESLLKRAESYITFCDEAHFSRAWDDYEAALALDPLCADAHIGKADIQIRRYAFEEAIAILEAAQPNLEDDRLTKQLEALRSGDIRDSWGRSYFKTGYDAAGNRLWYHVYRYNADGTHSITAYDDQDRQISYGETKVDDQGRQIQSVATMLNTGMLTVSQSEYDERGNKVRSQRLDEDGNILVYGLSEYDDRGNCIRSSTFNGQDVCTSIQEYVYNEEGKMTDNYSYTGDGTLTAHTKQIYNEWGSKAESITYQADGTIMNRWVWSYNEDKKMVALTVYDGAGNVTNREEYGTQGKD